MTRPTTRVVLPVGLLLLIILFAPIPVQSGKPPCPQGSGGTLSLIPNLIPTAYACPPVLWSKSYGNAFGAYASSVTQTPDGGFIVVGITATPEGYAKDVRIVRLDSDGNVMWQGTYGGSEADVAGSLQPTSDGGYVVAGYTSSFGSGQEAWVLRLDGIGNVVWQKTYGGSGGDSGANIQTMPDGGFALVGFSSLGPGGDAWVVRLDENGNVLWQKTYGGAGLDAANSIRTLSDGGFIVAGYTTSFGAGGYDAFVLRLDDSGNIVWQKTYGGVSSDYAYSVGVVQSPDTGFIVAGTTSSFGVGSGDAWVLRLDSNGNVVWQRTYGGSGGESAAVRKVSDGSFVFGSTTSFGSGGYDAFVLRLDDSGNIVWQKTYGGSFSDWAKSIDVTADGGLVLAGRTDSFPRNNGGAWVLRMDANGNLPSRCSFVMASAFVAIDSAAITTDSSAVVNDSAASVTSTAATRAAPTARTTTQC